MSALNRLEELLEIYISFFDNAATFLLTLVLAYVFGRYVVEPLVSYAMELRGTDRTLRQGIERLTAVGVIVTAVVIALTIAGLDFVLQRTAILVAALTVALGFAAQHVVGNLVSGAFIVTDSKFNIGDWIRWEDEEGVIEDISFRATRVRTFDNEVITVPNSTLTQTAVTNAVLNESLRLEVTVEINYDDDVEEALYILRTAADSHPEILEDPEPIVLVTELDEAVQLAGRFWISDPNRSSYARIRSEYARSILEHFEDAGIDLGRANPQALEGDIGVVSKDGDDENESGSK
ncbi:mechanosensitive ion channel family protein [Halobacteria archaeon AArc-m2/3/4]|uniref:Mechanosensitive ion channel family protein n=1 Tax=Natronoglomus mannanivorans TaxID=2979990 RepID=A0ABT2QC89_9EURY|nr:mechanosensitive ion channel family protein [Halobacteria archaeon AArc-m2/3/4]